MSYSNQGQPLIRVPPQGTPIPPEQSIPDHSSYPKDAVPHRYSAIAADEACRKYYGAVRYDERPRRREPVTRRTRRDFHESWVVRDVKIS